MNILLIQPQMSHRPMDTGLKARMAPSLALLTIKSLTPSCHSVKIINENIESIDFDSTPDLVAITVTVDVLNRAAEIAKRFRNRGIIVAAGGIHITGAPETAAGMFDALLIGRAESTWLQASLLDSNRLVSPRCSKCTRYRITLSYMKN